MDGPPNQGKALRSTVSSKACFVSYQQGTIFKYCCENRADTMRCGAEGHHHRTQFRVHYRLHNIQTKMLIPRSVCEGPSKEKQRGGEEKANTKLMT